MMSVSPPGHKAAGDGFEPPPSGFRARRSAAELPRRRTVTREGLEPSRRGGHGLLRAACLPVPPPGHLQWTVEGVEPSSAGCKPTVFPLDDTPIHRTSGPGGGRTHIPLFKRQVLRRLSYKASHCVTVPWKGFEPSISTLKAWRPLRWSARASFRVPGGSRTRLSGLEDRRLGRSATGTSIQRKERESNPQGLSLGPLATGCHRPLACPSVKSRDGWI
jgi:hypothetical protein